MLLVRQKLQKLNHKYKRNKNNSNKRKKKQERTNQVGIQVFYAHLTLML